MTVAAEERTVHLAGSVLDRARHVCAFFHTRDEEYRVLMPFIAEGFDHGDRAFHIVDPKHREDHRERLREGGIDTESAEASGQLTVLRWEDAYLRGGHFDQNAMLALLQVLRIRSATLPAIAVSGYADEASRDRVLAAGFNGFVAKPLDPTLLADEILRALATR